MRTVSKAVSEQNESVMRELVNDVLFGAIEITAVADDQLVAVLSFLNAAYRRGEPVVGDEVYDGIFLAELQERNPSHPFLTTVEPEPEATFSGNRVRHPRPMLSTEKAYTIEDLARWVNRVRRGAEAAGFNPDTIDLCLTPRLDGIAGRDDGERLVTRGDGLHGEIDENDCEKDLRAAQKELGELIAAAQTMQAKVNTALPKAEVKPIKRRSA